MPQCSWVALRATPGTQQSEDSRQDATAGLGLLAQRFPDGLAVISVQTRELVSPHVERAMLPAWQLDENEWQADGLHLQRRAAVAALARQAHRLIGRQQVRVARPEERWPFHNFVENGHEITAPQVFRGQ